MSKLIKVIIHIKQKYKARIAVLIGAIIIGASINMGIITISGSLVPPPEGVDPSDIESLKSNIHLFKPINFLMPFLAHALGVLAGAFIAAKFTSTKHLYFALAVGGVFLIGGIMMVQMLPEAPIWFKILDIGIAYLPMAWLGWKLSGSSK